MKTATTIANNAVIREVSPYCLRRGDSARIVRVIKVWNALKCYYELRSVELSIVVSYTTPRFVVTSGGRKLAKHTIKKCTIV